MFTCSKVLKTALQVVCSAGIIMSLTGCFEKEPDRPLFKAKALEDKARGITIASSKPYNCKIVGETEGYDGVEGFAQITREKARMGAINDLKNQSVYAIKEGKKVMIAISKESMECNAYPMKKEKIKWDKQPTLVDCTAYKTLPKNWQIISYKVYGDLYDCGEK